MEPSLQLLLAAIVFGFGFAIGQTIWAALTGALSKARG